jgi:hypothetical protein
MLMPNCLFRVGGAAILLSNRRRDAFRAKYELQHTVRTHLGANDLAYRCIFQQEDEQVRRIERDREHERVRLFVCGGLAARPGLAAKTVVMQGGASNA